jgi:hypothetical protein
MSIKQEQVQSVLDVHNALWDAVYDLDSSQHSLIYNGVEYSIKIPAHRGYASVMLPNKNGVQFMWITQNLHKSSYGTMSIANAKARGEEQRITWIVDTRHGKFTYVSNITSTKDSAGNLVDGSIERYDDLGREILWSLNGKLVTRKAQF